MMFMRAPIPTDELKREKEKGEVGENLRT